MLIEQRVKLAEENAQLETLSHMLKRWCKTGMQLRSSHRHNLKNKVKEELTNLEINNSYKPSKCMSFTGTWLPMRSDSNLRVKTVPIF